MTSYLKPQSVFLTWGYNLQVLLAKNVRQLKQKTLVGFLHVWCENPYLRP